MPIASKFEPAAPVSRAAAPDVSIAVLPFLDMSEKKDQEYFSDGISEELIDLLSRTPKLRVIARTSSFQFKGKSEDMRAIAQKLGVTNLLEGSVRKAGRTIRVTAQLIKAMDGSHLWSETYDRDLADTFKVQDEICATVVGQLRLALLPSAQRADALPHNVNTYNVLLRGNYLADRRTREDTDKAIERYQEAIRSEPDYARAWVDLARAYFGRALQGWGVSPAVGYAQARSAVEHALQLDPKSAAAHRVLGDILEVADWDWVGAQREYARAQELDPDSSAGLVGLTNAALAFGRLEEAIGLQRQALLRDPLSATRYVSLAIRLIDAGRPDEAEVDLRKALEINPVYTSAHYFLAMTFIARGRNSEALQEIQRETDDAWRKTGLPFAYDALGRRAESDAALEQLKSEYAYSSAFNVAEIYAFRDAKDLAFAWLERALRQRDAGMLWLTTNAHFKDLRSDPRYRALLNKLNLPQQN
jgi:TolB-like protein/Tfp pilus assembly protein PilF